MPDPTLVRFRRVVSAAYAELEARRQEVNDLNVFPVADGDTGDNMALTMKAVMQELDALNGQPIDVIGREELVGAVARAALLGARGNSGVILSQVVRGAAEELASRPGELVDPVLVAAAFARAADAAYDSVREPAEGTMLTAVREMAHRVAQELAHMEKTRLSPDATDAEQDELLAEVLERALEAGKQALARGPDQLRALREAGVVDAGAYGLMILLAAMISALRGDRSVHLEHQSVPARDGGELQHVHQQESRYRYCTNFAVTGDDLDSRGFIRQLEELGDCVMVVGDRRTLRVHVHTDDPEAAVALFEGGAEVSLLEVADMREQVADRSARLSTACGVLAVASGEGLAEMFRAEGATVVDGGRTLNPSTYELLAGIHSVSAREVIVLPNSRNVILAADRAAELSERPARVVPTRSLQEGLAALLAFNPQLPAEENVRAMADAAAAVLAGGVTGAARDDVEGRFRAGEAVGYVHGELVAWGDPAQTLAETLARIAEGRELVTCIVGEGAPLESDAVEAAMPEGVELELHEGGQPAWWWLFSAD